MSILFRITRDHHFATEAIVISAQIESELVDLSEQEALEYLRGLGVEDSGVHALIRAVYHLLGLRTFLTTGEKETRAWTIHAGDKAPAAAGAIHSDFERGFIAAETIHYNDLVAARFFRESTRSRQTALGRKRIQSARWRRDSVPVQRLRLVDGCCVEPPADWRYRTAKRLHYAPRYKNPTALLAADDFFSRFDLRCCGSRYFHVAAGANTMLHRDDRRVAFAVEQALELVEQIRIDFCRKLFPLLRQFLCCVSKRF